MAAKTWETDFRLPAIQASIRRLGDSYHDDPFKFPGSFCIPVAEKPFIGWTPGRVTLVVIILGFAFLIAGALLGKTVENGRAGAGGTFLLGVAVCCSLSGIVMFFLPVKLDRQIISWLMGDRARQLIGRSHSANAMAAELSNADRSKMKISVNADDHVLMVFDEENRRVMIEGIAARYQIRAADIEGIASFQWMNYIGVEITFRIDPQVRLTIAIARVSILSDLLRRIPLLFFLRDKIPNRLLKRCVQTLQSGIVLLRDSPT